MSFREKSAWVMGAIVLVTGLLFAYLVGQLPADAPPQLLVIPFVPYILTAVILSIIAHAILGIFLPKEAKTPADERERIAIDRAGHWSGIVMGAGVITGLIYFLWDGEGQVLFLWCVGALIGSQLANYACQIALFRRGG